MPKAKTKAVVYEKGVDQDPKTGVFLKGKKGGPGRPKGSRNILGETFLEDLLEDWEKHGQEVIQTVRKERPADYLKVVASILPRDINVNVNPHDELTDAELIERLRSLQSAISPLLAAEGSKRDRGGAGSKATH